ncbi:tripartite tricarboxylate transporter TctB family protein [Peribacillus cavernae]|uniref:Tripartite tricarboxylate transporter TctB family protein n=1 Tax=Peribacillus cavernae TaxID=1674310 RepID=A0A433HID7_9BACI|nr:tripartite tricarboxylate transporter TctB family protein [Peribacillus cavernae]MDQ0217666.1 putative tricarboxylic transport membrane protein [Peribacillus cavernae]RUQ28141.1 tripartite tricarboxylate transporter TctB family protein [Peribacillus cavernae]
MNKNIVSGIVVFLFALIYTIMAFRLPASSSQNAVIGPSVFPTAIGILLIVTSVMLIGKGIIEQRQQKGMQEPEKKSEEEGEKQDSKKVFVLSLLLLGYVLLFFPLGYLISTALFILSVTMFLDRGHWIRNVIYSLAFPVTIYLIFDRVLAVYLPLGPLGGG